MEPKSKLVVGGPILILIGTLLLFANQISFPGWAYSGVLGAAFLVSYFLTKRYGLLVAGCIISAVGVAGAIADQPFSDRLGGGLFLMALGIGFLSIYVLGARWQRWWPLVPGSLLMTIGVIWVLAESLAFPTSMQWERVSRWWPASLVLIGIWLIVRHRLQQPVRFAAALVTGGFSALLIISVIASGLTSSSEARGFSDSLFSLDGNFESQDTVMWSAVMPSEGMLVVRNTSGRTVIRRSDTSELKLLATKRARSWSQDQAADKLARIVVDTKQDGNKAEISWAISGASFLGNTLSGVSVDYDISVPENVFVDARTTSGDIEITAIDGDVKVTVTSGDIVLTGVRGAVDAKTSSGNIVGYDLGSQFRLNVLSGNVDVSGAILHGGDLSTTSGNVRINPAPGSSVDIDAKTISGNLSIAGRHRTEHIGRNAERVTVGEGGPSVIVRVTSGNITLK